MNPEDVWPDQGEAVQQAWTSYLKKDWKGAEEAASRALSAATDTIKRETEMEVGAMAVALRSEAAAHVLAGCVHERRGEIQAAFVKYRQGLRNPGEGILALLNAMTADPSLSGPRIELASALCAQNFANEALAVLDDLKPGIEQAPPALRAAAYAREGQALYATADYTETISKLRAAIDLDPDKDADGWMHGTQGWALLALGRMQEARPVFEIACAKDPQNMWWQRGLADVYDALGQKGDARRLYRAITQAAKNNPAKLDAESFRILAWCYLRLDEQEDAVQLMLNSVGLNPGLVSNQFDLALILLEFGTGAALREYQKGVRLVGSKPIPRRYGLLHDALHTYEAQPQRDEIKESEDTKKIHALLKSAHDTTRNVWEQVKSLNGKIWKWVRTNVPIAHLYAYLSNPQNSQDFLQSFRPEGVASRGEPGSELTWRLQVEGLRKLTWKTQVTEQIPYSRICHLNVPTGKETAHDGFSLALTLIPVKSNTIVLVRVFYPPGLITEEERGILAKHLEGDLEMLRKIDVLARTLRFRRPLAI
jgi:tetratricopeptide (TPR) repeat protein